MTAHVCATRIYGPKNSVNVLSFSPGGRYLASGNDDGVVHLYDVQSWTRAHKLSGTSRATALLWVGNGDTLHLYVGFGDGILLSALLDERDELTATYLPRAAGEGLIEDLAYINRTRQLAVCADSKVEIWTKVRQGVWKKKTLPLPSGFCQAEPRSVHAADDDRALLVSYLDHGIYRWNLSEAKYSEDWRLTPFKKRIGRSALAPDGKFLAISNLYDGVDVYNVADATLLRTIPLEITDNIPLPLVFVDGGAKLIAGSSCGKVSVCDVATGQVQQVLDHSGDIVQALAYLDMHGNQVDILATGRSEKAEETCISIWHLVGTDRGEQSCIPAASAKRSWASSGHVIRSMSINSTIPVVLGCVLLSAACLQFAKFFGKANLVPAISSSEHSIVAMPLVDAAAIWDKLTLLVTERRDAFVSVLRWIWQLVSNYLMDKTVAMVRVLVNAGNRYIMWTGQRL